VTAAILGMLATLAIGIALGVWPADDPEAIEHRHDDLPADHPHLAETQHGRSHVHAFVIDDLHSAWPARG